MTVASRFRMLLVILFSSSFGILVFAAQPKNPNVIFILCDDLGFGDTGPTFQGVRLAQRDRTAPAFETPALDLFAREGMILRNHYSAAPVCAPARASLLLGVHQGHANVRDNQFDKAIADNHTLATVLRTAGYATAAFGKWGLQGRLATDGSSTLEFVESAETDLREGNPTLWPGYPTRRGFDYFFGYARHKDGHEHYPKEDGKQVWELDRDVTDTLDGCYTTDLFTARAKKWITDHRAGRPDQPFFIYLAYDTPHASLQFPPGAYPKGGGVNGGVQWLGRPGAAINTARGQIDGWCDPEVASATWDHDGDSATPEVQWPEIQRRHATVVRRIDAAVGDLVQLLKDLGIDDETLVVFTSDNGPSAESGVKGMPYASDFFDGFGPFSGIKRDVLEGGIREPTLVRWPGHIPAGAVNVTPSAFWDWMPTFAELAGVPPPAASDGVSLVPVLTGKGTRDRGIVYIEYFNNGKTPAYVEFPQSQRGRSRGQMQLIVMDGFNGLRYNIESSDDDFEIYDIERDPRQEENLAKQNGFASLQTRMKERVLQVRRPDWSAERPYDDVPIPSIQGLQPASGQIECSVFNGSWPWVPQFESLHPDERKAVEAIDLSAAKAGGDFGVAFAGYFHAVVEGEFTFTVTSDAGAQLFIHDARVIDDDFGRTGAPATGTARLSAGWHPFRLYSRHGAIAPNLSLQCSGPGMPGGAIPATMLAPASANLAASTRDESSDPPAGCAGCEGVKIDGWSASRCSALSGNIELSRLRSLPSAHMLASTRRIAASADYISEIP